jgi:hypothetical protein
MMRLPERGDWKTVREADDTGGRVPLSRDEDQVSLGPTIGAFFNEKQWEDFKAAGDAMIAEGRLWRRQQGLDEDLGATAAEATGRDAGDARVLSDRELADTRPGNTGDPLADYLGAAAAELTAWQHALDGEPGTVGARDDLRRSFMDALAAGIEEAGMEAVIAAAYQRVSLAGGTGGYWIDLGQAGADQAEVRLLVTWEADIPSGPAADGEMETESLLDLTLSGRGARDPRSLASLAVTAIRDDDERRGGASRTALGVTSRTEASRQQGASDSPPGEPLAAGAIKEPEGPGVPPAEYPDLTDPAWAPAEPESAAEAWDDLASSFTDALAAALEGTAAEGLTEASPGYWIEFYQEHARGLPAAAQPVHLTVAWESDTPVGGADPYELKMEYPLDLSLYGTSARNPRFLAGLAATAILDHHASRGGGPASAAPTGPLAETSHAETSPDEGADLPAVDPGAAGHPTVGMGFPKTESGVAALGSRSARKAGTDAAVSQPRLTR